MASSSGFVPRRRPRGLLTEHLEGEVLLYVEPSHRAFCLNEAAAQIWESIDGARDVATIARDASLDAELVGSTLRDMGEAGLLEEAPDFPRVDLSRRRLVRAGLVAIPLILAITVPRAAEAASNCTVGLPGGPACTPTLPCCTGICNENLGTCG
jgi:Coenzyme PQQ synthesis protein D (PqqD)